MTTISKTTTTTNRKAPAVKTSTKTSLPASKSGKSTKTVEWSVINGNTKRKKPITFSAANVADAQAFVDANVAVGNRNWSTEWRKDASKSVTWGCTVTNSAGTVVTSYVLTKGATTTAKVDPIDKAGK